MINEFNNELNQCNRNKIPNEEKKGEYSCHVDFEFNFSEIEMHDKKYVLFQKKKRIIND